jgi:hypothetical protein
MAHNALDVRNLKYSLVLAVVLLAVSVAVSLGFSSSCGSQGATPAPSIAPTIPQGTSVVSEGGTGQLILKTRETTPGGRVQVAGIQWENTSPVELYLLTEAQFRLRQTGVKPVKVGEVMPTDGAFSFEFALMDRYDGTTITLSPGTKYYVAAAQVIGDGSQWASQGPLIVSAGE